MASSEGDAQALVRQLRENPEMLDGMHHLLSLLRSSGGSNAAAPRETRGVSPPLPVNSARALHPSSHRLAASSPAATLTTTARPSSAYALRPTQADCIGGSNREEVNQVWHPPPQLSQQQLNDAQRRVSELEEELGHVTKRVEQLISTMQLQKQEMAVAADRHQLELAEVKASYEAMLHRKDEVHEASLQQLLKSRQLLIAAAKYEAAMQRVGYQQQQQQLAGGGLSTSAMSVNIATAGAGIKSLKHGEGQLSQNIKLAVKRERLDDEEAEVDRRVRGGMGHKEEAPSLLYSTAAATPPRGAKTSTLLVNARTQSRGSRKRRTPRTPSLTHAERIATSSSGRAPQQQQQQHTATMYRQLPGTKSLQLDSPTPVPSSSWTTGRSPTTTPPAPPLATAHSIAEAVARRQQATTPATQRRAEQTFKTAPLQPRTAGRLPPAPPNQQQTKQAAQLTPIFRSGTSSVARGGPTRSPSPVNPRRGAALPRRFIFTGLKEEEVLQLSAAIAALGDGASTLASDLDEPPPTHTTHIVLRGTPRSVKALCGSVSGCWLVSPDYILRSQQSGFWLDELDEGGLRIFPPPLKCQRFLLTMGHDAIREKLGQVIEYGGGEVLQSRHLPGSSPQQQLAQDVIVISSGDDLLRYATQER